MAKTTKFHPATEAFPAMRPAEYEALKADIQANGLLEPIWRTKGGLIIDGRHRFMACEELGVEPAFAESLDLTETEALSVVVALNLRRRHLTDSQRAMVGGRLKPMFVAAAAERMRVGGHPTKNFAEGEKGESREKAAEMVNVSGMTITHAEKVLDGAVQELVEAVDRGDVAVSDAAKAAGLPKKDQKAIAARVAKGDARNVKDAIKKLRLERQVEAIRKTPPPEGQYEVIVADPPWTYDKNRADDPTQRGQTPYPTMSVEEICAYPVPAAKDCILWLWCTNAMLADGTVAKVLDAWGFTGKTILTWGKTKMGLGDWLRGKTEHCVLAVRGKPVHRPPGKDTTLFVAKPGRHSAKPDAFYKLVERLCPGKKAELFSREQRKGWAVHGPETEGAIE